MSLTKNESPELEDARNSESIERLTYSIDEFARATGLSRATVWRRVSDGVLPTVSIGRRRLIPLWAIQKLIGETQ